MCFLVPYEVLVDCFKENTTLISGLDMGDSTVQWFLERNKVCKDFGASKLLLHSIPLSLPKDKIREFVRESIHNSEVWKTMKLVVLGHGRIGKTTLLHQLRASVNATPLHNVLINFLLWQSLIFYIIEYP